MNKPIRAAIIEDEIPAARLLNQMVRDLRPEWEIIPLPGTIEEAVEWFAENEHPEVVFLDIQLNDGLSFHFIEQARPQSSIIFTTAYDDYAVRAFTVNSIDYLLKPIHRERLEEALCRFERLHAAHIPQEEQLRGIEMMLQSLTARQEKPYRTRFLISGYQCHYVVQTADIAYFYSENKMTYIVTRQGKEHIIDLPLSKLENQLDENRFMRVNRQFILSADCIRTIAPHTGGKVVLTVSPPIEKQIIISKENISSLKLWLDN